MKFTRLNRRTRKSIVDCFVQDIDAATAARLLLVNRKTLNIWYKELRQRVALVTSSLSDIPDQRVFKGYHERRTAKFNGLRPSTARYHVLESRARHQLGKRFGAAVYELASDLLS